MAWNAPMITTSCTSASARTGCGTATTGQGPSTSTRRLWAADPRGEATQRRGKHCSTASPRAARTASSKRTAAEGAVQWPSCWPVRLRHEYDAAEVRLEIEDWPDGGCARAANYAL